MKANRARRAKNGAGETKTTDPLAPSAERLAHGLIERLPHAIADEDGRPAQPLRARDTIDAMLRRGTITEAMRQASENFRALFATAQLETLRAADLSRLADGVRDLPITLRQAEARKRVWLALKALGGIASPAGSCVWHVIGCEWTLKDWALRQGWNGIALRPEAASGILIGSLGILQAHFGL